MNDLQRRVRQMSEWKANFDGEGAPAPHPEAMQHALKLAEFFDPQRVRVTVGSDGLPIFFFRGSEKGELCIEEDGTADIYWLGQSN